MKKSLKYFASVLLTLVVSGCASCPCEKAKEEVVTPAPRTVAAPVAVKPVAVKAPVAPAPVQPVVKKIPAAVMK